MAEAALQRMKSEFRRLTMGPLRLRRQVFSPKREFRRIDGRVARVREDPSLLEPWQTHLPVLVTLLRRLPNARVLELGMGYASTPVLLQLAGSSLSIETDPAWLARFARFETARNRFVLLEDFSAREWKAPQLEERWDVVFIDNSPYSTRQSNLVKLASNARFVVCHDTEECYKPAGSDYRWDFSAFEHVWTYTGLETYTTVVSNVEPIPLDDLPGVTGQPVFRG